MSKSGKGLRREMSGNQGFQGGGGGSSVGGDSGDDEVSNPQPGTSGNSEAIGQSGDTDNNDDLPLGGYVPPLKRQVDITEEDTVLASQMKTELESKLPADIDNRYFELAALEIRKRPVRERNIADNWLETIESLMDEQARVDIREMKMPQEFEDQLYHMLHISGLRASDWRLMLNAVVLDNTDSFNHKLKLISLICKNSYKYS